MIDGIYISAAGALIEQARHDITANNVANVNTIGFKKQMALLDLRRPEAVVQSFGTGQWCAGGGLFINRTVTDFSEGPIERTNNPLDLAVNGQGFFAVSNGEEPLYTRAGDFAMDADGYLTTAGGEYRVLDENGKFINISGGVVEVGRDGHIYVSNGREVEERGVLGLFTFDEIEQGGPELSKAVEHIGQNLYRYHGNGLQRADGRVAQGCREQSTVNAVEEMVKMIEGFRAYEANMMALRSQDSTLQRAVTQVGKITTQ